MRHFGSSGEGQEMIIRGSYAPGEITVAFSGIHGTGRGFRADVWTRSCGRNGPELGRNPVYQDFKLSGLSA